METCLLCNETLRLEVIPALGAGIVRFETKVAGSWQPLMRPTHLSADTQALDLSCVLMIPWTNRIFGGGFTHEGSQVVLEPNLPGNPVPLHGNALTSSWEVQNASEDKIEMSLRSHGPDLFDYSATVGYTLSATELAITVGVRHEGENSLPYGFGIHPWFVHTPRTTLQVSARRVCLVDEQLKPTEYVAIDKVPQWDFSCARQLPESLLDNSFTGWDGMAQLVYPELGVHLNLSASSRLARIFQIYSPQGEIDFVCFEPVSHLVNEHNETNSNEDHGLSVLNRGEQASGSMNIKVTTK